MGIAKAMAPEELSPWGCSVEFYLNIHSPKKPLFIYIIEKIRKYDVIINFRKTFSSLNKYNNSYC